MLHPWLEKKKNAGHLSKAAHEDHTNQQKNCIVLTFFSQDKDIKVKHKKEDEKKHAGRVNPECLQWFHMCGRHMKVHVINSH